MDGIDFEVPPGGVVTSGSGRLYTLHVRRAEAPAAVQRAADVPALSWRLRALFHRGERALHRRAGWRLTVREGGSGVGAPPFVDEVHPSREDALARAERLAEQLAAAPG